MSMWPRTRVTNARMVIGFLLFTEKKIKTLKCPNAITNALMNTINFTITQRSMQITTHEWLIVWKLE